MRKVNLESFNLARDWSQLGILHPNHTYISQYGIMAFEAERLFCVLVPHETKFLATVQRQFQQKYWKILPSKP
jgi:hypothetical protein